MSFEYKAIAIESRKRAEAQQQPSRFHEQDTPNRLPKVYGERPMHHYKASSPNPNRGVFAYSTEPRMNMFPLFR